MCHDTLNQHDASFVERISQLLQAMSVRLLLHCRQAHQRKKRLVTRLVDLQGDARVIACERHMLLQQMSGKAKPEQANAHVPAKSNQNTSSAARFIVRHAWWDQEGMPD